MVKPSQTFLLLILGGVCATAELLSQTTPPTITFTTPSGVQRGAHTTVTVEGTGLEGASTIVFSEPGLSGQILEISEVSQAKLALETKVTVAVRPYFQDPVKMQMKVTIQAEDWMATGTHQFRVITPRGSSTPGRLVVAAAPESEELEPNNDSSKAQVVTLPVTLNGVVLSAGDDDFYRFHATSGQEVVLQMNASALGSLLDPLLDVYDAEGKQVASNRSERQAVALGFRVSATGWYTVKLADSLAGGSLRHFYRLTISNSPFLKGRFPLGLRAGTTRPFHVWGFNLAETRTAAPEPFGLLPGKVFDVGALVAKTSQGESSNALPIAIGPYDEVDETGKNSSIQTAQEIRLPLTVNGRVLLDTSRNSVPDYYRFRARKGQRIILETAAARLGSPLDSLIEVLDEKGNLVPRLTARPVWKSQITLFDRDSKSPGLRIAQAHVLELDDYMIAGTELMKVVKLVNGPDEDVIFENFGGQRLGMEDTTPEAHALDDFIYKVELHPPGTQFPPNGMPLFHLYMRNDDGGPGYGKDSRVAFAAPADGVYFARVADVRNQGGDDFAYRLTIREPVPDFLIFASPANPNIPMGARVPIEVTALRQEGFEGAIQVAFDGLPEELSGTSGVIPANEKSVTLMLSLKPGTRLPGGWTRYRILGSATLEGKMTTRVANGGDLLKLVSVMPNPDIKVSVKDAKIRIAPGGHAQVTLAVERFNGFEGRVLFRLQDLPYGVRPIDVGLNGVMIAEHETERTFTLECRPFVKPVVRQVLAVGLVEALVPTEHPSLPVMLEVVEAQHAAR